MNKIFIIVLLTSLLMVNFNVLAQVSVEKSDDAIVLFGKTYYLHKVQKGQTFYSICNVYGVTEADIYAANPELTSTGLKFGITIKIPATSNTNYIEQPSENTHSGSNEYIYHTVKPQQTIFFITRKYNISKEQFNALNPEVKGTLKIGQKVKIPSRSANSYDRNYNYHTVAASETLFSLAQRYGLTMYDIEACNPTIANGKLSIGQILKIPTRQSFTSEVLQVNRDGFTSYGDKENSTYDGSCNGFNYNSRKVFKIGVLLPLFLQENQTYKDKEKYYQNTERFFEFYQGLLLAAKQMKINGLSVEFYLKDTRANVQTTKQILESSSMQNVDLIIGPVHSANFKIASNFARNKRINIVAPFQLKDYSNIISNPYVFLASPNTNTEVAKISSYLTKSYDKSVLMLHNGTAEEANIISKFRKNLVLAAMPYNNINEIIFKNVNYKTAGTSSIENALSVGLYNVVIVPSKDQVFITNIVTKLNYLAKKYKIILYGLHSWEKLRNIEISYLNKLSFHYGTTGFVNKKESEVQIFQKRYKTYFNGIASSYAYMGYDISYYFMNLLKDYGKDFQFCINYSIHKDYSQGLQYDFNFKRYKPSEGFENDWTRIVKVCKNLELKKVN